MISRPQVLKRVRRDDDLVPQQTDFRLAIPAGTLWACLLLAALTQRQDLTSSLAISAIASLLCLIFASKTVIQPQKTPSPQAKHSLFPRGSNTALAVLAAFTTALGFASHTVNIALAANDPLAQIGANPSHRFVLQAQVITTAQPLANRFAHSNTPQTLTKDCAKSWKVTLRARTLTWKGNTFHTRAKVQVKGRGWEGIPLGSTVELRAGLGALDPSGRLLGTLRNPGKPSIIQPPTGRFVYINTVRFRLEEATRNLAPETKALISAMTLGLVSAQPPTDREAMQISGLSHLTAVSGMHLSVLMGLALGLTSRKHRRIQLGVALPVMLLFLAMLEGSASVTRAGVMGTITLAGLALARPSRSISALSLAVISILLVSPWQASSWGFALSVVATFSIVTLGRTLCRWLGGFLPRLIAFPLAISLSAQLGCQPLMLIMRGRLQVFSLPANLATGAIASTVTVGGLALVGLATVTWVGSLAVATLPLLGPALLPLVKLLEFFTSVTAGITSLAAAWVLKVARFFSQLPGAEIPWIESWYGVFSLMIASGAFLWLLGRQAYLRQWQVKL